MDYNAVSCGVSGQIGTLSAGAKEKIHTAAGELFKVGLRRFLIAITGEAALLFAEAVLTIREQYPDAGIDVLIPFDGWIDNQSDSARYNRVIAQAESVNYSCAEEYEDSTDICNTQLIGFGRCTVFIHNGEDETMRELAEETRDADQEVKEIII